MDVTTFRRILTAFADSPADFDLVRGTLLLELRGEMLQVQVVQRLNGLFIVENGEELSAPYWLIHRVAKLPLLADRILAYLPNEPSFVTPGGELLDQLDEAPTDTQVAVTDAADCTLSLLGRRPAGTASVLYLTSDAGEGKTTLITHMARTQAQLYKDKKQEWLLLPVSLGGRTFMRFDDVIIGALVNRLRFPFLYYEAFLELLRLGVVVPAFDGFEEMFVEGSAGDAISALGNLVQSMQSSGAVLIAARKAYFEYKDLQSQTRLFDSLGGQSVSFARLALKRWDKAKFLEYALNRQVEAGEAIYNEVSAKLGVEHPLLTRAVLVRRLLDVAAEVEDRTRLLASIQNDPADYFRQFIGTIIGREAREKWLDKQGELAQPLITEEEHYELLAMIALEMWQSNAESLRADVFDLTAELFADSRRKDKVITQQIIERVKQHALIVQAEGHRFTFDHQEFYYYFLGEGVGKVLGSGDRPMIVHVLRQGVLPPLAAESASRYLRRVGVSAANVVATVNTVALGEPRASFVKDNLGGILIRLLDLNETSGLLVCQGSFPMQSLAGRHLVGVEFRDSYFQSSSIHQSRLVNCRFTNCEFESLELHAGSVEGSVLEGSTCRAVIPINTETAVFAPVLVTQAMTRAGFTFAGSAAPPEVVAPTLDDGMAIVERMLRAFLRSSGLNENTLNKRLGVQAPTFFNDVLPRLMTAGIVQEVPYKGASSQRRFCLGRPLDRLNRAVQESQGQLARFMQIAGSP